MKKIKNFCLVIICLFIIGISFNVKADGFQYYLTNSNNYEPTNNNDRKNINRGDTIVVTAMINNSGDATDYKINSGKLTVRWDNKYLRLLEVNGKYYNDSISDISGLNLSSIDRTTEKISIGEISSTGTLKGKLNKIAEFKFQVLENAPAGNMRIYRLDGEDSINLIKTSDNSNTKVDSVLTELKYNVVKSTENKLSSIKIDGKEINGFSETKMTYDINVEASTEKINIDASAKDAMAKVEGTGAVSLKYGINKVVINVTSESEEKKEYTLNITRTDTRSSVNTLKTLVLSNGDINFRSNVNDYTVNVENDVEEITITSSLTDSKSKYVDDYSKKTVKLVEGSNKIQIKVISEKGEENIYTININRALSTNNSLKSLKVNDEKIELQEDEFTYSVTVENDVDSVVIKAVPNDPKATVELQDKYDLIEGENEIEILVVASSGDKASYILNVNRKKTLSQDSVLKSLVIKGYDIKFKPEVKTYYLEVSKDVDKLEITYETEDPNATVEVEGNKDLIDGSIVKVNVKAEDGTYTRYFINVEKPKGGISPVIIIILVFMLLLGTCLGLLFFRKKKAKEKEKLEEAEREKKEIVENKEVEPTQEENIQEETEISNEEESSDNVEEKDEVPQEETPTIERGAHEYAGEHEYTGDDNEKDIE